VYVDDCKGWNPLAPVIGSQRILLPVSNCTFIDWDGVPTCRLI